MFFLIAYLPRWSPGSAPLTRVRGFCWEKTTLTGGDWSLASLPCFSWLEISTLMARHCEGTWTLVPFLTFLDQCFFSGQQLVGEELELQHLLDRASMEHIGWTVLIDFPWLEKSQPLLGTWNQRPLLFSYFQQSRAGASVESKKQKKSSLSPMLQILLFLT